MQQIGSIFVYVSRLKRVNTGSTLAEMLVAVAIMGIVLIPILFLSSAWFSHRLVKTRENLAVSHNSAIVLTTLTKDLSHAKSLLPNSGTTATSLYYTTWDPVKGETVKRGYELVDDAGERYLRRAIYVETTGSWGFKSPYSLEEADIIRLPATTEFQYCDGTNCGNDNTGTNVAPEKAISVKLTGWSFTKGARTVTLPDLEMFLASSSTSNYAVSEKIRQMFSMTGTDSFGSGLGMTNVYLTANQNRIGYLDFQSGAGNLSVIESNSWTGGHNWNRIATDGRTFYGDGNFNSKLWSWKDGSGLSILSSGGVMYAGNAIAANSAGRVVFDASSFGNPQGVWVWDETIGVSRILTTMTSFENAPLTGAAVTSAGRVFHADPGNDWVSTWHESTGVSILISGRTDPGYGHIVVASDDRVFFGEKNNPGNYYTWKDGNGLSYLISGYQAPGRSAKISTDDRVIFADQSLTGTAFTWKDGDSRGVSALISGLRLVYIYTETAPGGRLFFGEGSGSNPGMWTWNDGSGVSKISSTNLTKGMTTHTDGRIYFGEHACCGGASYWTWKDGSGLSQIGTSNMEYPGQVSKVTSDGRIYFGDLFTTPGKMYTWKDDNNGITTIGTFNAPGHAFMEIASDGRLYFDTKVNAEPVWTWKEGVGLSGMFSGTGRPYGGLITDDGTPYFTDANTRLVTWNINDGHTVVFDQSLSERSLTTSDNYVFFSRWGVNEYYVYKPGQVTYGIKYGSETATPTGQSNSIGITSGTFVSTFQASDGSMYLANATDSTIDRFAYASGVGYFKRTNQLNWPGGQTVTAIAAESANDDLLALTTSGRVYLYTNRALNNVTSGAYYDISGTVTTPTGLAINGRTGDYLVLDSDVGAGNVINLYVFAVGTNTLKQTVEIDLDDLTGTPTGETNFKILYNDEDNLLYLVSPTATSRVYGLSLPDYLN